MRFKDIINEKSSTEFRKEVYKKVELSIGKLSSRKMAEVMDILMGNLRPNDPDWEDKVETMLGDMEL